eukprot:SAG22_NODE_8083_length_685_cov_0.796928_2_plen_138_part_00
MGLRAVAGLSRRPESAWARLADEQRQACRSVSSTLKRQRPAEAVAMAEAAAAEGAGEARGEASAGEARGAAPALDRCGQREIYRYIHSFDFTLLLSFASDRADEQAVGQGMRESKGRGDEPGEGYGLKEPSFGLLAR